MLESAAGHNGLPPGGPYSNYLWTIAVVEAADWGVGRYGSDQGCSNTRVGGASCEGPTLQEDAAGESDGIKIVWKEAATGAGHGVPVPGGRWTVATQGGCSAAAGAAAADGAAAVQGSLHEQQEDIQNLG